MLTPRMQLIADNIKGKIVADIGTDHAYIPIELMKKNMCEKVIASDVRIGPADTARRHIAKQGLDIEVRVGSGLSVLKPGEADEIIIAGMGGKLIAEILEADKAAASLSRLILQPMNGQYELRKYLCENNMTVSHEDLTVEGFKVYNMIIVEKCTDGIIYNEEIDFHLPPALKEHKYFNELRAKKLREFNKILSGYERKKGEADEEIICYYREMIKKAQEL